MKGKRIWVVTVDSRTLRVFEQTSPSAAATELQQYALHAEPMPASRERAPRVHDRMGPARHAIEKRTTPRTAAENKFLERVIDQLGQWSEQGAFDQFILCAPPRAAGVLKARLTDPLTKRLRALVVKDLTHETAAEITARLEVGLT